MKSQSFLIIPVVCITLLFSGCQRSTTGGNEVLAAETSFEAETFDSEKYKAELEGQSLIESDLVDENTESDTTESETTEESQDIESSYTEKSNVTNANNDETNQKLKELEDEVSALKASSNSKNGTDGKNGADGKTPYIKDGYWYIDGKSTGVKATGSDGKTGEKGATGSTGKTGEKGKDGSDGNTPYIKDGYWYIAGKNTGVQAAGTSGTSPVKGVDYLTEDEINAIATTIQNNVMSNVSNGTTPVKGVDYFTDDDINEIVEKVSKATADSGAITSRETVVGSWIDGSPLYACTYMISLTPGADVEYQHNIKNLSAFWIDMQNSFVAASDFTSSTTLSSDNGVNVTVNQSNIVAAADETVSDNMVAYITLRYTKSVK